MALDQEPTVLSLGAVKAIEPILTFFDRVGFVCTMLCPRPLVVDRVYLVFAVNEGVIKRVREGKTTDQLDTCKELLGGSLDHIPMLDLLSQADQQRFKSMVDVGLTRTELPDHVQPRDDLTVEQLADLEPLAQVPRPKITVPSGATTHHLSYRQLRDIFFLLCIPTDDDATQGRLAAHVLHVLPKDEAAYSAAARAAADMGEGPAPAPLWVGRRPSRRGEEDDDDEEEDREIDPYY
ncbi:hypothetical protein JCM8208_006748 [Rhodotorula glutinis]